MMCLSVALIGKFLGLIALGGVLAVACAVIAPRLDFPEDRTGHEGA